MGVVPLRTPHTPKANNGKFTTIVMAAFQTE